MRDQPADIAEPVLDPKNIVAATEALLASRPCRPTDHGAEAAALLRLADEMAQSPDNVLPLLSELILDVCRAESAGVSLLKGPEEGADFFWPAISGAWAPYVGGGMPREASPCGVVLRNDAVVMYHDVEKHFPAAAGATPLIREILLAPFHKDGKPVGTVWAILHSEDRGFDGEDRRQLISLARFASATYQHITVEASAREAQQRLNLTLSNAKIIALWDWDISADRVTADTSFAHFFGVDPASAATGLPIDAFLSGIHADDRERVGAEIGEAIEKRTAFISEYRACGIDGAVRTLLAHGQCEYGSDGAPLRLPGVIVDVSDQRRAETALSETRDRYQSLFNSIDAGFCVMKMIFDENDEPVDYRFVEVNPAFEAQTGLRNASGRSMRELSPGHEQYWFDIYGEIARTGQSVRFENHAEGMNNRWFEVYAYRIDDPADGHVAALFTDITHRRRMEMALRASEDQFRNLAQAMPNHVWTARTDGQLDWFNERVYEYSGAGAGELDGERWAGLVHPDDLSAVASLWAEAIGAGREYETEFRIRRADGSYRWHLVRAVPIYDANGELTRWIGTNTDIEDRKAAAEALIELNATLETRVEERTRELVAAEDALRQAQKMEAVGQLTGGIAHDFNNMLTGITGSLDLIERRIADGRSDGIAKYMAAAQMSAGRAAALTHRLLAFARRQSLDTKPQDIGALVAGMTDMLRRTLGETIQLESRIDDGLWSALTDANQLENALLNLAINARDAMPHGGRLTITTSNVLLDSGYSDANGEVAAGDYVLLSVRDTGSGMSPEIIAKVFEPFFTTKPIGQGTGLGLSMIYGFARQSGGHVRIDSEVGLGTTVQLYLRRAVENDATEDELICGETPRGEGETVLVVEDDATVRLLVTEVLDELGYVYFEAADAQEALVILESTQTIDLMISDVGLPNMNGRQLAEIARQRRPELKILFVTGYAEDATLRSGFLAPGMEMMTKPFIIDALAAKVRHLIEG